MQYNIGCRGRMQTAVRGEYMEKYSRGRRGAPAKGVGRLYRRESSNLSFCASKKHPFGMLFCFLAQKERFAPSCAAARGACGAQIIEQSRVERLAFQRGCEDCSESCCGIAATRCEAQNAKRSKLSGVEFQKLLRHQRATKKISPQKALIFQGFLPF